MKILFWFNVSRSTIYCRITVCSKRAEISTGIRVNQSLWDSVRQTVKDDIGANYKLAEMKLFFLQQEILLNFFTAESLKEAWINRQSSKRGKPSPRLLDIIPDNSGGYKGLIKHLKTFMGKGLEGYFKNLRLHKLNQAWADDLALHLVTQVQPGSAKLYIQKLRTALGRAITKYPKGDDYPEMIEEIPFKGPVVSAQHSTPNDRPGYLNLKQYEAIKTLKPDDKDAFYLKCFLWQCATGQSMIDMMAFTAHHIFQDVKGEKYIKYIRHKTHVEAIVPISSEILTAMHDIGDWQPVRELTERNYNRAVRRIGDLIGYDKMTSHVARHTFGVMRLIDGYTMESVAKQLGHGSIRITEKVYAKVTVDKIFKEKREISLSVI